MDTFMNLAKKGYEAYSESQSPQSRSDSRGTGGEGYNTSHQHGAQSGRPDQSEFGRAGDEGYNTSYQPQGQPGRPDSGFRGSGGEGYNTSYQPQGQPGRPDSGFRGSGGEGYNAPQEQSGRPNSDFRSTGGEGYNTYQGQSGRPDSDFSRTGGEEYNTPHHRQAQSDRPDFDHEEVARQAAHHSGGTGDSSLFASAMNFVQGRSNEHEEPIDENQVRDAHDRAYNQGSASSLSANSLGSAAAMQVFKQFTGGGKGSGSSQNELISMAMGEASKLFDKSGASSGGKQDAVNGAAMTVMKLVVQSKFKSAVGGSDSGGLGNLMSMASKFM